MLRRLRSFAVVSDRLLHAFRDLSDLFPSRFVNEHLRLDDAGGGPLFSEGRLIFRVPIVLH